MAERPEPAPSGAPLSNDPSVKAERSPVPEAGRDSSRGISGDASRETSRSTPPPGAPSSPAPSLATPQGFLRRHGMKLVLSLILGAGLAWVLADGGLPLVPSAWTFTGVRWWTLPVYVALIGAGHYFRAIRWRFLLRPLGRVSGRSVLAVSWIAFAAILLSPFRSGEVMRPYLITKRGSVRLWEATATIGAERVIDGLVLSVMLFAALQLSSPLSPLPDHIGDLAVPVAAIPGAAYGVLALFLSAFAVMGLFFWRRDLARRITHRVVGVISHRLADLLGGVVERVADGLRFLPSGRLMAPFLLETALYWITNACGLWLLAWGAGLEGITLAEACVTLGVICIGILVPAGPGYFGVFQLSTFMGLAMFFPEDVIKGPASAFVFLLYLCQVGVHLLGAVIGILMDPAVKLPDPIAPLPAPDAALPDAPGSR
jgi:hypothetical protein